MSAETLLVYTAGVDLQRSALGKWLNGGRDFPACRKGMVVVHGRQAGVQRIGVLAIATSNRIFESSGNNMRTYRRHLVHDPRRLPGNVTRSRSGLGPQHPSPLDRPPAAPLTTNCTTGCACNRCGDLATPLISGVQRTGKEETDFLDRSVRKAEPFTRPWTRSCSHERTAFLIPFVRGTEWAGPQVSK